MPMNEAEAAATAEAIDDLQRHYRRRYHPPIADVDPGGGLRLTSLVPIETSEKTRKTPQPPSVADTGIVHHLNGGYVLSPATDIERAFRHRSWAARRERLQAVITRIDPGGKRLERWTACGAQAMVYWHEKEHRHVVFAIHCHDRFCWPCANGRSRLIAGNLGRYLKGRQPRFATLTLRSSKAPLSDQVDRLYSAYKTLRCDSWWKTRVSGAATFCEITLNPQTLEWHPHLHPLLLGEFLPQSVLARKWLGVTGDSPIAHIKFVPDTDVVVRYVCKYASKPMDDSVFAHEDRLTELVVSIKGRRLCLATGELVKAKLTDPPAPTPAADLKAIGSLHEIHAQAALGQSWAAAALTSLQKNCVWSDLAPFDVCDHYGLS